MRKQHLTKQEKKQVKQQRAQRKNARGKAWKVF